ncbi:uncharacterized protein [Lepeophtheirus salmonis]|uniref:uncharacterized protein n=1 Tax=Lepeophtheirus salmonis TaxID=72036 RepID=UPI001AEB47E9|nr:uncharacterized protein LOC121116191 [Lepeophtheirus salmonis]
MMKLLAYLLLVGTTLALPYSTNLQESSSDTLIKVAEKLNLKTFVQKALGSDVSKIINHDGPFTVFAPNDTAFTCEQQYPTEYSLNEAMLFHVAMGKIMESDITHEKVVKSLLDGRTIRFNVYNGGQVKTANGRRIMKTDNVARNGVVHVIGGVMSSIFKPSETVATEIVNHYPQHSTFMELVKMSKLFPLLNKMDTPYTLFAPTNEAMAAVDPSFINALKSDMTKLRATIMGHIVKGTWFTPGLISGQSVKTEMGAERMIKTDESNGVISIGEARIVLPDIIAANGAVHSVDKLLFSQSEVESSASTQTLMERMNKYVQESKLWSSSGSSQGSSRRNSYNMGAVSTGSIHDSSFYSKNDNPFFKTNNRQVYGNEQTNVNYLPQDVWSSSSPNGQWNQETQGSGSSSGSYGRTYVASSDDQSSGQVGSWYQGGNGWQEMQNGANQLKSGANDVVSSLKNLGHTEFAQAMENTGISSLFKQSSENFYTLFAPSNEGWNQAKETSNEDEATLVTSHIVSGIRNPGQENVLETLNGNYIHFDNLNSGRIHAYTPRTSLTANGIPMDGRISTVKSGHVRVYSMDGGFNYIASTEQDTLMKRLMGDSEYSKFVSYVNKFGMNSLLDSRNSAFTILAPTNEAMTQAESKLSEQEVASTLLANHFVPGSYFKSKMTAEGVLKTLSGTKLAVHLSGSVIELTGGVHIVKSDMASSNGVIHQVDQLISVQSN